MEENDTHKQKEEQYPKSWNPKPIHIKSGWKNNPSVLQKMVTFINDEMYVEDENEMMEKLDFLLEFFKKNYIIKQK